MYKELPSPEIAVIIFKIRFNKHVSEDEQHLLDTARAENPNIQEYYEIQTGMKPNPNPVKISNIEIWWIRKKFINSAYKSLLCKKINKIVGFELFHEWTVREKLAKQRLKKLIPLYYKYLLKETIERVCNKIYNRKKRA